MKMLRYDPFLHPPLAPPCLNSTSPTPQSRHPRSLSSRRPSSHHAATRAALQHPDPRGPSRASRPNPCTHAHPRPRGPYTTTQPETPTCLRILLGMPNAASWHSSRVIICTSQSSAHRRLNPRARAPSTSPGCPHSSQHLPISKQITTPQAACQVHRAFHQTMSHGNLSYGRVRDVPRLVSPRLVLSHLCLSVPVPGPRPSVVAGLSFRPLARTQPSNAGRVRKVKNTTSGTVAYQARILSSPNLSASHASDSCYCTLCTKIAVEQTVRRLT